MNKGNFRAIFRRGLAFLLCVALLAGLAATQSGAAAETAEGGLRFLPLSYELTLDEEKNAFVLAAAYTYVPMEEADETASLRFVVKNTDARFVTAFDEQSLSLDAGLLLGDVQSGADEISVEISAQLAELGSQGEIRLAFEMDGELDAPQDGVYASACLFVDDVLNSETDILQADASLPQQQEFGTYGAGDALGLSWEDGSADDPHIIKTADDSTGVLRVSLSSTGLQSADVSYKLKISFKQPDDDPYYDGETGFQWGSYAGDAGDLPLNVSAVQKKDAQTLEYTLDPNFTYTSFTVSFLPKTASGTATVKTFDGELLEVTAELIRVDGSVENPAHTSVAEETMDAQAKTEQISQNAFVTLPSGILPLGPATGTTRVEAELRMLNAGADVSTRTFYFYPTKLTMNVENVVITVGTTSKTYAQWLAEPDCPVRLYAGDGTTPINAANGYTITWDSTSGLASAWGWNYLFHPFIIELNENFKEAEGAAPKISFDSSNIAVTTVGKVSNRGPVVTTTSGQSHTGKPVALTGTVSNTLTASLTLFNTVIYHGGVSGELGTNPYYLLPDSASETRSFLKEQHLFEVSIAYGGETAVSQAKMTLEPSAGIIPTQLFLSKNATFTSYKKVESISYENALGVMTAIAVPIDQGAAGNESKDILVLIPDDFKQGGKIEVVFKDFHYLRPHNTSTYNLSYGIHLYGMTSGLDDGDSVSLKATIGDNNSASPVDADSSFTRTTTVNSAVRQQMTAGSYSTPNYILAQNTNYQKLDTIRKGEEFIIRASVSPDGYPYGHITSTNPASANTNNQFTYDPLLYISLPAGVEVVDLTLTNGALNTPVGYDKTGAAAEPAASVVQTLEDAGVFAESGGSVAVIRVHEKGDIEGDIFVQGIMYFTLRVKLLESATIGSMNFTAYTVLAGSWAWDELGTSEAFVCDIYGGRPISKTDAKNIPQAIREHYGFDILTYPHISPQNVTVAPASGASAYVSTRLTGSSYRPYVPGNDSTLAALRAGSENEKFRATIEYNLPGATTGVSHFYYVLPANWDSNGNAANWRTKLNAPPVFSSRSGIGELEEGTDYTVYYSTDEIKPGATIDAGGQMEQSHTWQPLTFAGGVPQAPSGGWGSVTAMHIVFGAGMVPGANLLVEMPFGLPGVSGSGGAEIDSTAIGQTLYHFAGAPVVAGNEGYTGGVILRKSDAPEIWEVGSGNDDHVLIPAAGSSKDLVYKGSANTIPAWWQALIVDDFTPYKQNGSGMGLESLVVSFTPAAGRAAQTVLSFGAASGNTAGIAKIESGITWHMSADENTDVDAALAKLSKNGAAFNAQTALEYVNLSKAGSYVISYVTKADADSQKTTRTLTLNVNKVPGTLAEVEFMMNDGSGDVFETLEDVPLNTSIEAPEDDPARRGYAFAGWYETPVALDPDETQQWDFENDTVSQDMKLYAGWKSYSYLVSFDKNAGNDNVTNMQENITIASPNASAGDVLGGGVALKIPIRDRYGFDGWWYEDGQGVQRRFTLDTVVTGNLDVYALWLRPYYQLSFDVNYGNSGNPATQSLYEGDLAQEPPRPSRGGYDFVGWYTQRSGGSRWVFASTTMPANDVTLYARWSRDEEPERPTPTPTPIVTPTPTPSVRPTARPSASPTASPSATPTGAPTGTPDPSGTPEPSDIPETSEPPEVTPPPATPTPPPATPTPTAPPAVESFLEDTFGDVTLTIGDTPIPLVGRAGEGVWALLNLILMIIGVIISIFLAIHYLLKKKRRDGDEGAREGDESDEEKKRKNKGIWTLIGILLGIVSLIVFFLTENMRLPMVIIDKWTLMMGVLLIASIVFMLMAVIRRGPKDDPDENDA